MSVGVHIVDGPIGADRAGSVGPGVGARGGFDGIVRGEENGRVIDALEDEAEEPMATKELERLSREMLGRHGLAKIEVWHSRGRVGVGEVSFRLVVESAHRKEAIAAMDEFIDRMKRDVPIWKRAGVAR